jgi:hypothetical protein
MVRCKNAGGAPSDGDESPPRLTEVARGKRKKITAKKRKRTLTEAEIAQAVTDAAELAERGGRGSRIHIGERRFHLEGRQLGTEAIEETEDPPAEQPIEETEEQTVQTSPRRRSGRTCAQVTPRPEGQRRRGCPPPRARGHPPVEHFDLRGATTRQVQALRFVKVGRWFPPQWDPRALEGFYTPLHEDFYRAYVDSRIAFRPQRVCHLEALVAVVSEQLRPHLSFLPGLLDFLG